MEGTKPRARLKTLLDLATLAEAVVTGIGSTKKKQVSDGPDDARPTVTKASVQHARPGAAELHPGEPGFEWKARRVNVPGAEFGEDSRAFTFSGTVIKASGMHVHIYFEEDNVAYWFKKKTVRLF